LILLLGLPSLPAAAENPAMCSPARPALKSGDTWQTLQSGGIERRYRLYIPAKYDPAQRTPLVLSFHGFTSNGDQQALLSGWDAIADDHNFIVVYPQGTGRPSRWYAGRWALVPEDAVDDVAFVRDLLTELERKLCVDTTRIYANGVSNGAGMSNRLACELADQIAAVGGVAGAYASLPDGCQPARPIPVIAFHGTADPLVDYEGNRRLRIPAILSWAKDWAARNGCDLKPAPIPATGDVSGLHYQRCKADADVILYTIDGGGHTWPGSKIGLRILGKTSADIDASATMWAFFQAHPLRK
jgi:polyhydroxybutyrate depolymerase